MYFESRALRNSIPCHVVCDAAMLRTFKTMHCIIIDKIMLMTTWNIVDLLLLKN